MDLEQQPTQRLNSSMDILFLTPQLPFPPRQGTTIRNYHLIAELSRRHTIDLLTFLAPTDRLLPDNPLHRLCRTVETAPQPERTLQRRALDQAQTLRPDMGLRLETPAMHELVARKLREHRYDIVQCEGIELAQYGRRALAMGPDRPKLVFDNHNCEYLLQKRNALTDLRQPRRWVAAAYSLVQWQKLRHYEAAICRQADAVVAVSQADRDALQQLAPDVAVTVVENGIDLDAYARTPQPPAGKDAPILVFTGKMDYRPNIDAVLWFGREVLPLIQARQLDVRFQIVGMNPHSRLDELRTNPAVEITGAVDAVQPYIHAAAVYVIPMRVGGGTRFKVLEAMAGGKAIVSTRLGAEGFPVQDGRELLLADTPSDFAAAVLRLLADQTDGGALTAQLGVTARTFVEESYGWPAIVPKLDALYNRLLDAPPAAGLQQSPPDPTPP